MRPRHALILAVIAAVLSAYVYLSEIRPSTSLASLAELQERSRRVFDGFDPDAVVSLSIERLPRGASGAPSEGLVLHRQEDGWIMSRPVDARADAAAVSGALKHLVALEREGVVATPNRDSLVAYGLAPPGATLTLTQGGRERRLALGGPDPTGAFRFAARPEEPGEVFLVNRALADGLLRPAAAWLDPAVVPMPPEAVAAFTLERAGREPLALAKTGPAWNLTAPLRARARTAGVESWLGELAALQPAAIVGFGSDALRRWGLDRPLAAVRLTDADGGTLSVRFARRDDAAETPTLVAATSDFPVVFALRDDAQALLDLTQEALRSRRLADMDPRNVRTITVTRGERAVALERDFPDGWRIVRPEALPADAAAVEDFLNRIAEVRVKTFGVATDPAAAGLAEGGVASVTLSDGQTAQEIVFGHAVPEDAAAVFVSTSADDDVMVAQVVPETMLPDGALAFRDRRPVRIDPGRIVGFEIEKRNRTYRVAREGADWVLDAPVKRRADQRNVEAVVEAIAKLRVARYVADQVAEPARYGLASPKLEARLDLERMGDQPAETVRLRVGLARPGTDEHFADIDAAEGLVFTVDRATYDTLDAELCDRHVLSFDLRDVAAVTIGDVDIRRANGRWERDGKPVAADKVDAILDALADLEATRFVAFDPTPIEKAAYGVAGRGALRVTLAFNDPNRPVEVLYLGDRSPRRGRFAMRQADHAVFETKKGVRLLFQRFSATPDHKKRSNEPGRRQDKK